MAYKLVKIYLRITNQTDYLKEPIAIYNAFKKHAGRGISSSNFNKYGINTGAANLKIEIRMDVTNATALKARLQKLTNKLASTNRIQPTTISIVDWNEPAFVIRAHETATKCAVAFADHIDSNPETMDELLTDVDNFMWKFMIAVLRGAGFRPNIIWGFLREPIPSNILDLAATCSPILQESIENIEPTGDFMERFVHCLFNCTISNEDRLLNTLQTSNIWQDLANSRNT